MGSVSLDGVKFRVWSHDHPPAHAHGMYGSTFVVVEFADPEQIQLRRGSIQPANAKRSDVRRIVNAAVENYAKLVRLWEATHG